MRKGFQRTGTILHIVGNLLQILSFILLLPLVFVFIYWGSRGEGIGTIAAFVIPAAISFSLGLVLMNRFEGGKLGTQGSMLMCAVGWLCVSALGALPYIIGIGSGCLNAYFEAMSGFTTTGFTVFTGLDEMPKSILFWPALTQWLGGLGILSFFLIVTFRGAPRPSYLRGGEPQDISSGRPSPGLFSTLRILWGIYVAFTVLGALVLTIEKMPVFDSVCHSLTALSTGGFSPHDSSIEFYRLSAHPNYKLIISWEVVRMYVIVIGGGKADVFMVIVPEGARVAGKSIVAITGDSDFPSQCVFVAVYNQEKDEFCIPRGKQVINEQDELFLISPAENIKQVVELLTRKP